LHNIPVSRGAFDLKASNYTFLNRQVLLTFDQALVNASYQISMDRTGSAALRNVASVRRLLVYQIE